MAQTKTVSTLERARDAFVDIKDALETKTGQSLDNVVVEQYDTIIANINPQPSLQTKSLTPDFSNGNVVVEPDQGYDGIDEVTITKDVDLVASNIKKNVDLFGIVGSYEGSGGGLSFTNLAYFFYSSESRKPADYWQSVVEANDENCTDFRHMCDGSVFDSGTYPVDLTGIVDNTKIQYMFGGDSGTSTNGVANLKVKLGSTISSLQYFCKLSTSMLDISKYFNFEFLDGGTYSQVVNLNQAFRGMFGTLDLTKIKGNHFTNLLNAFQQVSVVNDFVGIEDFDITGVTSIKEMFKQFDFAIFDFTNVLFDTLDLSGWDFSRIINMESLLNGSRIPYVKLNGNNTFDGVNMNNMFYDSKIKEVRGLEIQDAQYSNNGNESYMFYNCTELTSVISAAKWILCNGANGMFYNCSKLVTIPAIDLHIEHSYNNKNNANTMFQNCALLEEVTINIINGGSILLQCNDMFKGCSSLKEIKGNLDLTKIYQASYIAGMFNGCTALEKIATSGGIAENINQAITLDLSASAVFDIADFISNLAAKVTSQTRNIKLHSTVYSGLSQATIDAATAKGYTLISA